MADIPLPDAGRGGDARAHGNRPAAPVRKIIRVKARRICPLAGWLAGSPEIRSGSAAFAERDRRKLRFTDAMACILQHAGGVFNRWTARPA